MTRILADSQTFPEFLKYLQAFGAKDFAKDEGFSGYDVISSKNVDGALESVESCYLLKYVEPHEDSGPTINPYSIRHAAVYQKYLVASRQSKSILIRLSREMQEQLGNRLRSTDFPFESLTQWSTIHLLCLGSLANGWRQFINYLDEEVDKLFTKVIITSVDPVISEKRDLLDHSLTDMKRLQYLRDQAGRASHMLDLNVSVMESMIDKSEAFRGLLEDPNQSSHKTFRHEIRNHISNHMFCRKNVASLQLRAENLSHQLRDTITLQNSEYMKRISESTNNGNLAILNLSKKSVADNKAVKVITVVALIFVPASYVADFLQMGYVTVAQTSGLSVAVAQGFWLYMSITMPLIVVTMGIYLGAELIQRRAIRRENAMKDLSSKISSAV
ncbi:MAG: hypothetical protein MMC33_007724 [Icmadophila ericetorum]|nr:hypothetical protein [Icmadophila ericetorum]